MLYRFYFNMPIGGDSIMKTKIKFDNDEIRVLIYALNELRNSLIAEGRYTDAVDELILKLCD